MIDSRACAAVPVFDPASGRLEGSVNFTTWSRSSSDLLLALARSAASNTTALMVARSSGRIPRPATRGQVFRVEVPRLEPGSGTLHDLSEVWNPEVMCAQEILARDPLADELARLVRVGDQVARRHEAFVGAELEGR